MTTKILEHMKDLWINVQVYYDQVLGPECSCSLSGCEFDYQTNTYRLQVSTQLVLVSWHKLLSNFFTRPLLQKVSSLQEEILSVCLSVCLSVITFSFFEYSMI